MLKQGQCKDFLAEKLACQNRTFSKIKLLLRLAAFIDIHFFPEAANEKWDLNQLAHVHSVSMCYSVPYHEGFLMPMYYL